MNRSLQQIQTDFQDYVMGRGGAQPAIAADIAQQFGLKADARLAIYYDGYRIRMREALSEAYDKTHSYLGDEMFAELSAGYLQDYASHYRNLRWYGDCFSDYLAQALPDHPVVAELAAFEWALGLAFDAADAALLNTEDVRLLTPEEWERIGFHLQPSVQFLQMRWNTSAIWLALDQDLTPPAASAAEQAGHWLIWRKQLQPHFRSQDEFEALALQGLRQGYSFSAVCGQAVEQASNHSGEHDITPQIAGWLQSWLGEGVLAGINPHAAQDVDDLLELPAASQQI